MLLYVPDASSTINVLNFQTLYAVLFFGQFLLFVQLYIKIISGMANSIGPDQTAPFRSSLIRVYTVCICSFVRHFSVPNFRTFTVLLVAC